MILLSEVKRTGICKHILLFLILFLLFFLPYFIKGKACNIPIHDNLNQINMLGIFDGKFSADLFPSEGSPEFTLPGTDPIFHIVQMKLDKLFFRSGYFTGYVINEVLVRLLGFIGFFLLIRVFVRKEELPDIISGLLAFAFVTQSFWPAGYISIAGIPLLILSFINLYRKRMLVASYVLIVLYSFYSNFFLSGIYLFFILIFIYFYLVLRRKNSFHFLSGIVLFLTANIISNLTVFLNFFLYKIPTNRIAQDPEALNILDSIKNMVMTFLISSELSKSNHLYIILPICILIYLKVTHHSRRKLMLYVWILLIFNVFISGIYFWKPVLSFYNSMSIGFNFSRIYVLNSFLWYLLYAICIMALFKVWKKKKLVSYLMIFLISIQILINFRQYTFRILNKKPSYEDFMAEDQFIKIKDTVPEITDSRVGCIGFFPAVANFNGLRTVDSFSAYYPLSYKILFGKIIEKEIAQNYELEKYFHYKGSALFLFDDEIGFNYKDQNKIKKLNNTITCELDLDILKKISVKFLISTVNIINADGISLLKRYEDSGEDNYYRFYVYEII